MKGRSLLVGRSNELSLLDVAIGSGHHVLVIGDAGVGKSSLVERWLEGSHRLVLEGHCSPLSEGMPLLPLIDALNSRRAEVRSAVTAALSGMPPGLTGALEPLLPHYELTSGTHTEAEGDRLFFAVGELFENMAEAHPALLVLEDVHWADRKSLDLLTYLMLGRREAALLTVMTFRGDEPGLAEGPREWLTRMRMSPLVAELPIQALPRKAFDQQLRALAGRVSDDVADEIFRRSEGNPFFTEQLLAGDEAFDRSGLPPRLAGLVENRLSGLSPEASVVMTILAYAGRSLTIPQLGTVSGRGDRVTAVAVRELSESALVLVNDGHVRWRHELLREGALAGSGGMPRALHRRLAVELERLEEPDTAPEAATHYRLADCWRDELRMVIASANRAWDLTAYEEAGRWGLRAAGLWRAHPEALTPAQGQGELVRRTLRALDHAGQRPTELDFGETAWEIFEGWPNAHERAVVLTQVALTHAVEPNRSRDYAERVLADETIPDTAPKVVLLLQHAVRLIRHGTTAEGLATLNVAALMAERIGAVDELIRVLGWQSLIWRAPGDLDSCLAPLHRAELLARTQSGPEGAIAYAMFMSDHQLTAGDLEDAFNTANAGLALAAKTGLSTSYDSLVVRCNAAEALVELGKVSDAMTYIDAIGEHFPHVDDDIAWTWLRLLRTRVGFLAGGAAKHPDGRPTGNEAPLMEALLLSDVLLWEGRPDDAYQLVSTHLSRLLSADAAMEHCLAGQLLAQGARACADAAEDARAENSAAKELESLHRLEGLKRLAQRFVDDFEENPLEPRSTIGRIRGDLAVWNAEGKRAMGRDTVHDWQAAAAVWADKSYPHRAAYAWLNTAYCALRPPMDRKVVRLSLARALELARTHQPLRLQIEQLATKVHVAGLERRTSAESNSPNSLTEREQTVLRLVALGKTNAQIAEELYISPKTASVHVSNILRKLEAPNRSAAARWAHSVGMIQERQP